MSYWWFIVPFAFSIEQNNYFGWNGKPTSDAELITDGITLMLLILVAIGTINGNHKKP